MHDPLGLAAFGSTAAVEDERLAHADDGAGAGVAAAGDGAVLAGGLPVAGACGAVGALPSGVLAVAQAEEIPLFSPNARRVCNGKTPWMRFASLEKR